MLLGEAPPTAGLPPKACDLFGGRAQGTLEAGIARLTGAQSPILTSSGTAALRIAFEYLKRRSARRTVIVPAYTCPLVVLAAAAAGLDVVACDTVRDGFDLDLEHLPRLAGADTLAVVATHYGGALTDVARLRTALRPVSSEIAVVEDAAQAFGARWDGQSVGLAGDIGVFSFGAGKGFTIFQGGCLVSASPEIARGLADLSAALATNKPLEELWVSGELCGYHALYNPLGLRLVYGMPRRAWLRRGDEIRAVGDYFGDQIEVHRIGSWRKRVGSRALARLPAHLVTARTRFDTLAQRFSAVPGVNVHPPGPHSEPTGLFLFMTLPTRDRCKSALDLLWRSRLGVTKLFANALGDYAYLAPKLKPTETPNARDLAERTLTITTSPWLGEPDLDRIETALRWS